MGMRTDREKHYRKRYNCLERELTPDQIFSSPDIIPNLLKICVLPTTIDLKEDNTELTGKAVIDVHGHN